MKKYNKSEIMKRAWNIYRECYCSFSAALTFAWKKAKEELNKVTAADLQAGDTVEVEYGDFDNFITVTVASVNEIEIYGNICYEVVGTAWNGLVVDFCVKPDKAVKFVSKAQKLVEHAKVA